MVFLDAIAPDWRSSHPSVPASGSIPHLPAGTVRPILLVTPDFDARRCDSIDSQQANYVDVLTLAGALPLIPPCQPDRIDDYLALANGVVITGIRPDGQAMDQPETFERRLVAAATGAGLPLLGISDGMHLISRHLGGRKQERYRTVAHAEDGAVDAFEANTRALCLGVRWHMSDRLTALDRALIGRFMAHCRQHAERTRGVAALAARAC